MNTNENDRILLHNDINGRYRIDERTGVLFIGNTLRDDSGQYECLAQNILGTANARTTLLVRRKWIRSKEFFARPKRT